MLQIHRDMIYNIKNYVIGSEYIVFKNSISLKLVAKPFEFQ